MPEQNASIHSSTEYENYSKTSPQYDTTRVGVGIDFMIEAFSSVGEISGLQVLDAGCGTGNYIAACRKRVRNIVGVELNQGMIDQVERKFHDDLNVTIKQGNLLDIPCDPNQFDAATCNQVVHHLVDMGSDDRFSGIQDFFNEVFRVLRPGGVFVLNFSTPEQTENGFWWASLIPNAVEEMKKLCLDVPDCRALLSKAGFTISETRALKEDVLQGENYLDPRGPLKSAWRDGDSTWALASDTELASALKYVEELNDQDKMKGYLQTREQQRLEVGQSTSIVSFKP
jgi:ubiquinone/menaquinone biosynthesis C-methylase UbiE